MDKQKITAAQAKPGGFSLSARMARMVRARLVRSLPRAALKRLYRKMALDYISALAPPHDRRKQTLLILNHFYDQDVNAVQRANVEYNIVAVQPQILFKGAKIFFGERVRGMLAPYAGEHAGSLREYRGECERIFAALRDKFQIDLIVTPSDNYYWVREFISTAGRHGVKTVVLDKEGLISPHDFDAESLRIRNNAPFMSDHLFVWSERQREYWQKAGARPRDITVVGQARSDLFHGRADLAVDGLFDRPRPIIAFYTYDDEAYIPLDLVASEGLSWRDMKRDTQDCLAEMARKFPQYNFIFKAHPQQRDLAALQEKYDTANLKVVGGASISNELIVRAELIVAFQTTAVLEAMSMNTRLIYAAWDPLVERLRGKILPFDQAPGIVVPGSHAVFQQVCERFLSGDASDFQFSSDVEDRKHAMVSEYFHKPDGHVSERFLAAIARFLA